MNPRRVIPDVPASALRNVATPARVERVWQRIEAELEGGRALSGRRFPSALWAPAAFAIVFGCGVFVGANWFHAEASQLAAITSEPGLPAGPAPQRETSLADPERRAPAPDTTKPHRPRSPRARIIVDAPESPALPSMGETASEAPLTRKATTPEWFQLWNDDDALGAREAIERQGGFERAVATATPDQLMAMADIARSSHEPALAMAALRRVVERFPADPNAPYAALTLGNMLEKAGDRVGASRAYEVARSLSPKGDLAEDTLAQEIDAALEHGDLEQAKRLLDQYAKDFPSGSRLPELRSAIDQAVAVATAEASTSATTERTAGERAAGDRGAAERSAGEVAPAAPAAAPAAGR